jgi:hypothetical protein
MVIFNICLILKIDRNNIINQVVKLNGYKRL